MKKRKSLIGLPWRGSAHNQLQSNKFNSSFICFPPEAFRCPNQFHWFSFRRRSIPQPIRQVDWFINSSLNSLKLAGSFHSLSFVLFDWICWCCLLMFASLGGAIGCAAAHNPPIAQSTNTNSSIKPSARTAIHFIHWTVLLGWPASGAKSFVNAATLNPIAQIIHNCLSLLLYSPQLLYPCTVIILSLFAHSKERQIDGIGAPAAMELICCLWLASGRAADRCFTQLSVGCALLIMGSLSQANKQRQQ